MLMALMMRLPPMGRQFNHEKTRVTKEFNVAKGPVFTAGLTCLYRKDIQSSGEGMKIYVVCEYCENWGGTPKSMQDVVLGVFLSKERAEECLWCHASYGYSHGLSQLILEDGKAYDKDTNIYFEILEMEVNTCSKPDY